MILPHFKYDWLSFGHFEGAHGAFNHFQITDRITASLRNLELSKKARHGPNGNCLGMHELLAAAAGVFIDLFYRRELL